MECKTKGSCKGAANIRGNSAQTQNIGKGGKGTLANSGKRRKRSASFIGSQKQANAGGAVGSITNMECKTKGSCKGAVKIRGNSKQTQNIAKGGKGTLANTGKRRKRSASFIGSQTQKNAKGAVGSIVNMECKTKGSCKGAAKIRGNSAQTQNIGKGGKGTLANTGKRRKRSPIKFDKVVVNVEKGGDSTVKDCQGGKCKTAKLGPGTYIKDNSLA